MSYKIYKRPMDDSSEDEHIDKKSNKQSEWLRNLNVGDKIDFDSANNEWKIGTIQKIREIVKKNRKFIYITCDTTKKSKMLNVSTDSSNNTNNIILPLNTKTAWHQYLNNIYNVPVCDATDKDICYICQRIMCTECALIKQKYKFICGECMNVLKRREMEKCIQKVIVDIDAKIITIICDFAVGVIVLCCNSNCHNKIYFNNWFKQIYDYDCKQICYYKPNKHNNLKCINYLNNKIRIFCSVCTASKVSKCCQCDVKDTKLDGGKRYSQRKCYNHRGCTVCDKSGTFDRIQCFQCKNDFCSEKVSYGYEYSGYGSTISEYGKCGYSENKVCRNCMISNEENIIKNALIDSELAKDIIPIICEYAVGFELVCCNIDKCNTNIQFETHFDYKRKFDCNGGRVHYYMYDPNEIIISLKYINYFNNNVRIFCSVCASACRDCVRCGKREIVNRYSICGAHPSCHLCDETRYHPIKCNNCKKYFCSERCGIHQKCKECWNNIQKNEIKATLKDCNLFDNEKILETICEYAVGFAASCDKCSKDIYFENKFQYELNIAKSNWYRNFGYDGYGRIFCKDCKGSLNRCNSCELTYMPVVMHAHECKDCWINTEKNNIEQAINDCHLFDDQTIIQIICEYAIGFIAFCCTEKCNKYIHFNSQFDYKRQYDYNGKYVHYYKYEPNEMNTLKYEKYLTDKLRIFCSTCTNEFKFDEQCIVCGGYDILDNAGICVRHPMRCYLCNGAYYVMRCNICRKYCCTKQDPENKRVCGKYTKEKHVHQCKECWINNETENMKQILLDSNVFANGCAICITDIITQYSMGMSVNCCNISCGKYINFGSLFEYGIVWNVSESDRIYWDLNGNVCCAYSCKSMYHNYCQSFSYSQRHVQRRKIPIYSELMTEAARYYKMHNYFGENIRIFCEKCSNNVSKCTERKCKNKDFGKSVCMLHKM